MARCGRRLVEHPRLIGLLVCAVSFVLIASGTPLSASGAGTRIAPPVLVTTGPVSATRPFSCAPAPARAVSRFRLLEMRAELGPYVATLSGTVESDSPSTGVIVMSHPLVSLGRIGHATSSATLFVDDPAQLARIGVSTSGWSPGGSYRFSNICLVNTSPFGGPVLIVATEQTRCTNCIITVDLFNAADGVLTPAQTNAISAFEATIFASGEKAVLVANDWSFIGQFTPDAYSGLPLRVFSFADRKLTAVTRAWKGLIKKDAAYWMAVTRAALRQPSHDVRGSLGAWAADQCELGLCASAFRSISTLSSRAPLSTVEPTTTARYLDLLRAVLARDGYAR